MKIPTVGVILVLGIWTAAHATTPATRSWKGEWKGSSYVVCACSDEHLAAVGVDWSPDKGMPPMPGLRALALAREAIKKMLGEDCARFECEGIELALAAPGYPGTPWVYAVRFCSYDERDSSGPAGRPAVLPFVVYFDGYVAGPEKG